MSRPALVSPRDQPVTFVELFFDLVFVFAVTQLVALLHHGHGWETVLQALLVFWLVWWGWTQFTWALNPANTEHPGVILATLVATGVAFLMAVAVPDAFGDRALWFAAPYAVVRVMGLVLYAEVARANHPDHHAAVRLFGGISALGLAAVLGGVAAGGAAQYGLWGAAIVLDVVAAAVAGRRARWDLRPGHFAERHGLIVIIALGETLIVAAAGLTGAAWSWKLAAIAVLAVGTTCALWWSYFAEARPTLEHALAATSPAREAALARDAFSLWHFPMLSGLVAYALAVEEAIAHPATPLPLEARAVLGLGVMLFVGGTGLAVRRATGEVLVPRLGVIALTGVAVVALAGVPPAASLGVAFAGVAAVGLLERDPSAI